MKEVEKNHKKIWSSLSFEILAVHSVMKLKNGADEMENIKVISQTEWNFGQGWYCAWMTKSIAIVLYAMWYFCM